jgi:putative ATPase
MDARRPRAPSLFDAGGAEAPPPEAPLAARMRPRTLDEVVGQDEAIGPGTPLRGALAAGRLPSLILWGPPGSGKTSLARLLAEGVGAELRALSAVESGVAELRAAIAEAQALRRAGRRLVVFVDELHRWSKAQQDAILPHVESGLVTLIGATTENPSFEVNAALLSRCRVVRLRPLDEAAMATILRRAVADRERGLGQLGVELAPDALEHLVAAAGGDARVALTALELAALATAPDARGRRVLTRQAVARALGRRELRHDRAGDAHYDTVSALIKSVRGSDPDAALFWLARMLEAGEDPLFVARRLVILAAEDVGLADPQALPLAVAAWQAAHFLGLPEGHLPLAEATLYLALAPKSNSVLRAYAAAAEDARAHPEAEVPLHLRNAVTGLDRALGYGRGYRYAHDYEGGVAPQQHLPDVLAAAGRRYYQPGRLGAEAALAERLAELRRRLRAGAGTDGQA